MSSEIKYQDFVLSKIGWGVAIIFSLFGYVSYYLWIYPALASVPLRQNVYSKAPIVSPAFEDLGIQISAPLYLSNFQGSLLTITIVNDSVDQIIEGKLNLNITGSNLLVDENRIEKYVLAFLLEPKEVFIKNFTVKVLDNEDTHVIFTTNFSQLVVYDYVRNDFLSVATPTLQVNMGYTVTPEYLITPNIISTVTLTATPQISETFDQDEHPDTQTWIGDYPVEWIMDGYEWQGGKCKDETNVQDSLKTKICAINYPYGSFAESSLSKLLLPPWSGLSSLALVFGVVWLLEQFILSYGTIKVETLSVKQQWMYVFVLLFSGAFLLASFTVGIVYVFKTISYSSLVYYGVLSGMIILALLSGWCASLLFKSKTLNAKDALDGKESVLKSIKEAYYNRDLLRLEEIIGAYNSFDVRHQVAKTHSEMLKADLEDYAQGMIEFLDSKYYVSMLKKTESFFRRNKNLQYLPDLDHRLIILDSVGGSKRIDTGWIFTKASEISIYTSVIEELERLSEEEWKNKDICKSLSDLSPDAEWSDDFRLIEKELRALENKRCKKQDDDSNIKTE